MFELRQLHAFVAIAISLFARSAAVAEPPRLREEVKVTAGAAWSVGPTLVSGQPTEETLKDLAAKGITAVVSLRSAREMADRQNVPFDEPAVVRKLGMEYIHIPLSGDATYQTRALDRFAQAMKKHEGKLLVHCTVGFRASTMWVAYQTREGGLTFEDALAQGEAMALGRENLEGLLGRKIERNLSDTPADILPTWLVSPQYATDPRMSGRVRVLDVRSAYMQYFEGHVRGASHLDPHTLRGPSKGLPVQYRTPERMAEIFSQAGVTDSTQVIAYADGADILSATMTLYALERLGFTNASIVDGGLAAIRDSVALEQGFPTYEPKPVRFADNASIGATLADVESGLADGKTLFVDARPPEQYKGEARIWKRNGHIPGAVSLWWKRLTTDTNTHKLKPRDEIKAMFESAGITPDRNIIVYCGTSREATLIYMYLTRELDYPSVRLYEGAWTEYSAIDRLPVETGAVP